MSRQRRRRRDIAAQPERTRPSRALPLHIHALLKETDVSIALDHHTPHTFVDPYAADPAESAWPPSAGQDTTCRSPLGSTQAVRPIRDALAALPITPSAACPFRDAASGQEGRSPTGHAPPA
jgi:hypothetical protein